MTTGDSVQVKIVPGEGVVARIGTGVLIAPQTPSQSQLEPLLQALRATCVGQPAPGRALVRRVAGELFQADPDAVPDFAVAGPTDEGWAVLLHGAVEMVVVRQDSEEQLSGTDAATWVDRVIPGGFVSLRVGAVGHAGEVSTGPFELEAGIVPGAGIVIVAASTASQTAAPVAVGPEAAEDLTLVDLGSARPPGPTAATAPPAATVEAPNPAEEGVFQSILLTSPSKVEPREPLPVIGEDGEDRRETEPQGTLVDGILCERGHFNHPHALYCSACGVSTVHRTRTLVKGPRPPLGVLVGDDGSAFSLGADYLVGREPDQDDAVRRGELRPLRLLDAERSVSRVHAEIRLRDWDVVVIDRGSANGTYVAERGETEWRRLPPDGDEVIQPGTRVAFGKRFMTFDTHHQA